MQIGRTLRLSATVTRVLDLGPRARVVFAASWIAAQAGLVLTAARRPDHIFGFRMFPEASTLEIQVERMTDVGLLPAPGGEWSARDSGEQLRHFSWHDRVRDPILGSLEVRVFASYGVDAQLVRLQKALDDVADNIDEDAETKWIQADVRIWKNGRDPTTTTLFSHARRTGARAGL